MRETNLLKCFSSFGVCKVPSCHVDRYYSLMQCHALRAF